MALYLRASDFVGEKYFWTFMLLLLLLLTVVSAMDCASSKLDDLAAVALCRDRCAFLDEAIRQRYALAKAHMAYTRSLASVARSLHQFLEHNGVANPGDISSPAALDLPPPKHKEGESAEVASATPAKDSVVRNDIVSDSSNHLDFNSDSVGSSSSSLHAHSGHIDYIDRNS